MHTSQAQVEDGAESNNSGGSELKIMTPDLQLAAPTDAELETIVMVVRDMSSAAVTIPRHTLILTARSNVSIFLTEVGRVFRYEPNSFSIVYQRSNGDQVDVNELDPERCLSEIGFNTGANNRNNLILCNLHGNHPRKLDEDDLSLGASASPTSSVSERKMWYDVSPSSNSYDTTPECSYSTARIKQDTVGYVGLVNQAMTCYLNSLLQTLFMTPEFRNALYRWEFKGTDEEAVKSIPFQLQKLFLQLQTATRTAVETTNLTKSFGWDSSEVWQQHDIQELYRVMFDALEQCFKNTDESDLINNLYEGKMKDYVKCLECGTENAREDSFLDIPLPIRPFGCNTAYKSVDEALRAFVEPEVLTGNNKYECSKCNAHCDAHKGLKFTRFPYLLTLHLKRFDFDYQTFHRIKLNDKVTFPNVLDLNGFHEDLSKEDGMPQGACQAGSPDKFSADKLDDASTTDSGSALDAEESNSVEFPTLHHSLNDTDTQDEDEGIDVSSVYNEKNRLCISNGPSVYELFSIMVHSGSASGGHYYAYIKDFKTGEWFCFNDQSVSKITYDDIRKTYGGPNSRGYYSSWSSSANAYMLMYRQADKEKNVDIFSREEFPPHIKELVQKMITEEAAEREAREIERLMCKTKLFCQHPKTGLMMEKKFKVHKDTTLKETTRLAYEELMLDDVVPLERCRLVKYEEVHDSIECSFVDQDNESISEILGGVRSSYKFDLLMEIREKGREFEEYKPGGTTVKVFVVNLATEEVEGPQTVRACQNLTVKQFKELLGTSLSLDPEKMRIVQERYYNDLKPLSSDTKLLKDEGFYRSHKVYIEASGEEPNNFFNGSQMYYILERFEHTITLYCNLPERSKEVLEELQIPPYNEEEEGEKNKSELAEIKPAPEIAPCVAAEENEKLSKEMITSSEVSGVTTLSTVTTVTPSLSGSVVTSSIPFVSSTISPIPTPTVVETFKKPRSPMKNKFYSQSPSLSQIGCSSYTIISSLPPMNSSTISSPSTFSETPTSLSSSSSSSMAVGASANLSDGEDEGIVDIDVAIGSSSTVNSDQSASEDSSLTSDSDRTLVGEPPEDNLSDNSPDYHNVSSPEDASKEKDNAIENEWGLQDPSVDTGWGDEEKEDIKRYFRAEMSLNDILKVSVDKRITIGQLKKELQKYVGVAEEHFKLYKYYTNSSQEFECTRMTETLNSYGDNTVMKVRLGRALRPGEYKGKVFLLEPNNSDDPSKFLIDFVICKQDSALQTKKAIVQEVNSKCNMNLIVDKLRLRKKSWKNPQKIYLDHQLFDDEIILYPNWEMYLQALEGPEEKTDSIDELSLFTKRWNPSTFSTGPLVEIIITNPTAEALKEKLSQISGIPIENVEFAKGKGTFPCDMSVLEIPTELDWSPKSGLLDKRPIYIIDDGAVIYYSDKTEALKTLSDSERNDLACEESTRLNRDCQPCAAASLSSVYNSKTKESSNYNSRTREKGLKIYFNQPSQ